MPTLHIEHAITDFETWSGAFNRFADARRNAGAVTERVRRPVDDPNYVVVEVDFETTEQAVAFLGFLKENVWAVKENSPALTGTPEARILETAEV